MAYWELFLWNAAPEKILIENYNFSTTDLRGHHHPAISKLVTTHDVKISRSDLKGAVL